MSEPTFYHGTRRPFTRGGFVMPRSFHNGEGTAAPLLDGREARTDAVDHIYMTTSAVLAWAYAWAAPGRGKPKVLTVEPLGDIEPDPEHSAEMQAYRVRGMARVLSVDTTPLIDEWEAAAGWEVA